MSRPPFLPIDMRECERFDKVPGCCWRIAVAAIILGFLMVPAAVAVSFGGLSGGMIVLGVEVALACWLVWLRLKANRTSLAEFLTTSGSFGTRAPPLILVIAGILFWSPGLYTIVTAAEPVDPQPHQMNLVEQVWFGTTFLLLGLGVSALGISGHLARGSTTRWIVRLTAQIENEPDSAEHYFNRALLWTDYGDLGRAIEDFSEVIRLTPENVAAHLHRGDAYYDLDDYEQAIADYSAAIELEPQNPDIYLGRASAYADNDQPEKAQADFAKAQQLRFKA